LADTNDVRRIDTTLSLISKKNRNAWVIKIAVDYMRPIRILLHHTGFVAVIG